MSDEQNKVVLNISLEQANGIIASVATAPAHYQNLVDKGLINPYFVSINMSEIKAKSDTVINLIANQANSQKDLIEDIIKNNTASLDYPVADVNNDSVATQSGIITN